MQPSLSLPTGSREVVAPPESFDGEDLRVSIDSVSLPTGSRESSFMRLALCQLMLAKHFDVSHSLSLP